MLSGSEEVWELGPYVVEGWRIDEAIWRTGGVITRIEGDELGGGGGLLEVLQLQGNVGIRDYTGTGNKGEVSLRGFGENSGLRVLVLLDGIKVNGPEMGGIDWNLIPLEEVGLVEIIRGGQGVVYGQHASGGVIRIESKEREGYGFGMGGVWGSDGFLSGNVWSSVEVGSLLYGIGLERRRVQGYREHSESASNALRMSLRGRIGDRTQVSLRSLAGKEEQKYPGPLSYVDAMERPRVSLNDGLQNNAGQYFHNNLRFRTWRDWGEVEATAGWRENDRTINLSGTHAERLHRGRSFLTRLKVGGETRFVLSGFEMFWDQLEFETYLDRDHQYRLSEADLDRRTGGIYAFLQWELFKGTVVSGGLRGELATTHYKNRAFERDQVNPLDPVIWDPNRPNPNYKNPPDLSLEGSFAGSIDRTGEAAEISFIRRVGESGEYWIGLDRTYRYPVLDEVAAYQGYVLSQPINPELRAELGDQIEIGLNFASGYVSVSAAIFAMQMRDEIVFDELIGLNANLERTRRLGFECSLGLKQGKWSASGQWQYVEAQLDSGAHAGRFIPLVPQNRAMAQVTWNPAPEFKIIVDCRYESKRYQGNDYGNSRRVLDGYFVVGAGFRWNISRKSEVRFSVSNFLDERFISTAFNGSFYPGIGQRFEIAYTLKP